ncbi:TadG family pilus assembly protein [Dyella sp. 20L07]|uniref:TadG family pilus assembly protein n=1 Tax=Dyella sp. 20L07 TaxID=3384240 RepID=UPI003D2BF853
MLTATLSVRAHKDYGGQRQCGSTAIALMLMMLGLITMLGLVEVGYLYWAKRDTQKVADLAALAGAQQLQDCVSSSNTDNLAARGNAVGDNGFSGSNNSLTILCGNWDPVANSGVTDHFVAVTGTATANAVKVVATRPVTPFFGFAGLLPSVQAEAVASGMPPIAAFSIGTTLASVNGSATLPQLLQGIGIPISGTNLVGYQGLANVTITPAGLLNQLGVSVPADITVGNLNTLLASQLSAHALIDVLNAIVTVAGQQSLASANATLINAITTQIGVTPSTVTLGSTASGPGGLFAQIVAPDNAAQAALNAQVNALQLITTAIGVATGKHAVTAQGSVTPANLLGLPINITYNTSVIEPPSIGIGGIGTTAYTAQVRTFLKISTPPTGAIPLLGGLINISVNLPIAIDLVDAQATLNGLCTTTDSSGNPQATIGVTSSVLKMCVGNITAANAFSTVSSCDQIPGASTPVKLFGVSIASTNLASLTTSLTTTALSNNGSGTLIAGQTANIPAGSNPLAIGTTVNNLVTALAASLIASPNTTSSASSSQTPLQLATDLWNSTDTHQSYATRTQQALNQIQTASQGLQGLLGNVTGNVLGLLGNAVQLNVAGLLGNVGNLLGNVTSALGNLLNGAFCNLGSSSNCINVISSAVTGGGSGTGSNAFVSVLSFVLQALQPVLNTLGAQISSLLSTTLGINLGQNTVTLQSLQCHRAQLVY